MNQQATTSSDEATMTEMNNNFDHAMQVLLEAQRAINNAGVNPAAMASALAASYVTYVAALVAVTGQPKEQVIATCKEAIDTMDNFVDIAYERMLKEIAEVTP